MRVFLLIVTLGVLVWTTSAKAAVSDQGLYQALKLLDCPDKKQRKLHRAIRHAAEATKISPVLLACLMKTESEFRVNAVSSKGCKGLMQTPTMTGEAMRDTLLGAQILSEKFRYAKGNTLLALTLYKGGRNRLARKQAMKVLSLYRKVRIALRTPRASSVSQVFDSDQFQSYYWSVESMLLPVLG